MPEWPTDDWHGAEELVEEGMDLYHRGLWPEAETAFRKAIEADPSRGDWRFNLGLTLEAAGRDEDALACFLEAKRLLPEEAEPLLAAAAASMRLGRLSDALPLLEEACRIEPSCESAHADRISCLAGLGRHEEAETAYFIAQQTLEECPHCLRAMGESLLERGLLERAAWCFHEALRQDPSIRRVRPKLARLLAQDGRASRAVQLILQELRDDPGDTSTLIAFGDLLESLRRFPEAAEKFRRVLELEPGNAEAHWRLGELAASCDRADEAAREFEIAIQLDAERPGAHLQLGEARVRRGDLDGGRNALREQSRRLRADPAASLDLLRRTADRLLDVGDAAEADALLAHSAAAADPALLRLRAYASFRRGDLAGGSALSRRLLRIDPRCVVAMHNLCLAAIEQGHRRTAWGWWRHACRRTPLDDGLRRLRTRLIAGEIAIGLSALVERSGRLLANLRERSGSLMRRR
jgi:tetratricopeptide (TPR) repeat protein